LNANQTIVANSSRRVWAERLRRGATRRPDARNLTQAAQDALRQRVVETLWRQGLTQADAARMFGVSRASVNHWVKVFLTEGETGLVSRRRGRRPKES
jgi:hypothetical protein